MTPRDRIATILVHLAVLHDEQVGNRTGALAALQLLRDRRDLAALQALQECAVPTIAAMAMDLSLALTAEAREVHEDEQAAGKTEHHR